MEIISVLLNQLGMMFIVILIGFVCRKTNFIKEGTVKDFGNILLYVINPIVIFKSFTSGYSSERLGSFLLVSVISVCFYIVMILLSNIFYHDEKYCVENFASFMNNCGFFGLPIVSAVVGSDAVFYAVPFVAVFNIFQYTYGVYVLSRDKKMISIKKIFTNPNIIAATLGLITFLLNIKVPTFFINTFDSIGSMMSPLCSLIIGGNLASNDFNINSLKANSAYALLLRMLISPLLILVAMRYIDCDYSIKLTMLALSATPSATSTSIHSLNYGKDHIKGAMLVSISSLLTIVTMPLMFALIPVFWG